MSTETLMITHFSKHLKVKICDLIPDMRVFSPAWRHSQRVKFWLYKWFTLGGTVIPKGAAVPSLGLSNKAVYTEDNINETLNLDSKIPYPEESHFKAQILTGECLKHWFCELAW